MAGMIIAGYDPEEGGQVYCMPLGGSLVRQPFTIGFEPLKRIVWWFGSLLWWWL